MLSLRGYHSSVTAQIESCSLIVGSEGEDDFHSTSQSRNLSPKHHRDCASTTVASFSPSIPITELSTANYQALNPALSYPIAHPPTTNAAF
jgi:hypothetical protein